MFMKYICTMICIYYLREGERDISQLKASSLPALQFTLCHYTIVYFKQHHLGKYFQQNGTTKWIEWFYNHSNKFNFQLYVLCAVCCVCIELQYLAFFKLFGTNSKSCYLENVNNQIESFFTVKFRSCSLSLKIRRQNKHIDRSEKRKR